MKPHSVDPLANQPNTVLTANSLATADTVLSYCARIDGSSSSTYQAGINIITQGHTDAEIAGVRSDPEYSKTQTTINTQLGTVPFGSGLSACRSFGGASHHPAAVTSPIRTKKMQGDF